MGCTQDTIKRFPWTPERSASLWAHFKNDFVAKGATPTEAIDGLSAHYGIRREIIKQGLVAHTPRHLVDEVWNRSQQLRAVEQRAKSMVREMDTPGWKKTATDIANAPRRIAVMGHFGAFTKTHLADQLFYNPSGYARNFKESWSLATKQGRARLESAIDDMVSDPDYVKAKRSGLDIQPGGGAGAFARETKEAGGGKGKDLTSLAFDRLRVTRFQIFKRELQKLSPEEKADPTQIKALGEAINHDTGTLQRSNAFTRFIFFAPRLFPAQLKHTFVDIPKSLADVATNWKEAAPAARYVARKTAILASAYTATLAAEYGYSSATGDKRFMPNLTDINRTDWLRPRLFGYAIPVSPTVELLKAPIQMIAAAKAARSGESKTAAALLRGLQVVLTRQNPLFAVVEEAITGEQTGTGRPTPFPGLIGRQKETVSKPRMTYTEFLGQKLPIPVANYVREFYDELREQGMGHKDAKTWVEALTVGTTELATSYHGSERVELSKDDKAKKPVPQPELFGLLR